MSETIQRAYGRAFDQLRDIRISYNVFGYAPGSVLFELGNTKVLCSVTLQVGVPPFLKGTKTGWLTAEYAMLPTSCQTRATRESSQAKRNDRSVEISRLIGRSLRAVVDLKRIGERTIYVDCDVLQADGSTRTAAITGAFLALQKANDYWLQRADIIESVIVDSVAAVSVGFSAGSPLLDLDYSEDSVIDSDYNFILTQSQKIIEIQGVAEKNALSWQEFDQLKNVAQKGINDLFSRINQDTQRKPLVKQVNKSDTKNERSQAPLFSIKNRFNKSV